MIIVYNNIASKIITYYSKTITITSKIIISSIIVISRLLVSKVRMTLSVMF